MYENVVEKINAGKWEEAAYELSRVLAKNIFDEQIAVLAATVFVATDNMERARDVITKGLQLNCRNYELWLILGQTYENTNINQAYLCYENALYYCDNAADADAIESFLENAACSEAFCVKKCAIVILSYNSLGFTQECIQSIRATCPKSAYEIIVVDNASTDGSAEWLRGQKDIILQCNEENAGFPAGCNQGIRLAPPDSDIFLLNNDTIMPPNALFWLRMGLYENEKTGAAGAVSNYASNFQKVDWNCETKEEFLNAAISNNLPMSRPYEKRHYLVGFAMMIRRTALEDVGYLDEIFSPGTYEDNDLGFRLCEKEYEILLCRNSFIYHYGSGGGDNLPKWNGLYGKNAAKLADKWGFDPDQYLVMNWVLLNGIKAEPEASLKILDVGCGLGVTLLALGDRFPNAELCGIENNRNLWPLIPSCLNICHCGPETGNPSYPKDYFDIIILDKAFDNSMNQIALAEKYAEYLNGNGFLVIHEIAFRKRDILFDRSYLKKAPSIAMCIFTHNHPNTVWNVLAKTGLNYYLHGVDVYIYDSSEGDETKEIVASWINKGYTNLYYVEAKGLGLGDKMSALSRGEGLAKHYDYVWPSKDRSIWPKEAMDAVREHIAECPDIMLLEVRGNAEEPEKNTYGDGIELYAKHSLCLTSIDTTIYKYDTVYGDTAALEEARLNPDFPHFYFVLKKLAEMEKPKLIILQGQRIALYNIKTESSWQAITFMVWKDNWIKVNENLPDCYLPYREDVIKYVASAPWLIGGIERLQELKKIGALTADKLDEIAVNWERVSDIPFEEVRRIVEEDKC